MIDSLLAVVMALMASPLTPLETNDPVVVRATARIDSCLGALEKRPQIFLASEIDPLMCGLYDPLHHIIFLNPDQGNCDSLEETLAHELIHARGIPHPEGVWERDTTKDPFAQAAYKCGLEDAPKPYVDPLPGTFLFEGTTSKAHVKRLAVGLNVSLTEHSPFNIGLRLGMFNWINVREFQTYSPFGQLELGYKVTAGPTYMRVAQGIALVGQGPLKNPNRPERLGLASVLQFPTSLEAGIQQGDWSLGLLLIHYSNGGINQGKGVYDGLGVSLGRAF